MQEYDYNNNYDMGLIQTLKPKITGTISATTAASNVVRYNALGQPIKEDAPVATQLLVTKPETPGGTGSLSGAGDLQGISTPNFPGFDFYNQNPQYGIRSTLGYEMPTTPKLDISAPITRRLNPVDQGFQMPDAEPATDTPASSTTGTSGASSYDLIRARTTADAEAERKVQKEAIERRAAAQGWGIDSGMLEKRVQLGDVANRAALANRLGLIDVSEAQFNEGEASDAKKTLQEAQQKTAYSLGQSGGVLSPEMANDPVMVAAYEDGKAGRTLKLEERKFTSDTSMRNALITRLDPKDPNFVGNLTDLFNWANSINSEGGTSGNLPPLPSSITTPGPIADFARSGFWNTNGTNRDSFSGTPPAEGETIYISGKKYKVTSGIKFMDVWGTDNFDYFTVQGEDGQTYAVVPTSVGPTDAKAVGLPLAL